MAIPENVLAAGAEADEKLKNLGNPDGTPPEDGTPTDLETGNQPAPSTIDPNDRENNPDYWKQRFKVMEGKHKSDTTALMDRIDKLIEQNTQLAMQRQQPPPVQKQPESLSLNNIFTPEEREKFHEEFGEDGAALVSKIVNRVAGQFSGLSKDIAATRSTVEQNQQASEQSARAAYFRQVESVLPNWKEIDQMRTFNEYLDTTYLPHSDITLRQAIINADKTNDANKVIGIMREFMEKAGLIKPKPKPKGDENMNQRRTHVDPQSGPAHTDPNVDPNKKIWTQREIKEFYKDAALGSKYSADEVKRIDKDITEALGEGRIKK